MKTLRFQISAVLIIIAGLAVMLPDRSHSALALRPDEMIERIENPEKQLTVDDIASLLIREDSSLLLVDVRPVDQYLSCHIPGAINIPLKDLLKPEYAGYLNEPGRVPVFYSNGNAMATEAWMLASQSGYNTSCIMLGGINEWFRLVMDSEFSGEKISAAENALFETRYRARAFFTQMNSLPDSLKSVFLEVKMKKEAQLTGGCE